MKFALPLALALLFALKLTGCASSEKPISSGGGGGDESSDNSGGSAGHPGQAGQAGAEAIDRCCMLGAVCHVAGESAPEVEECHHLGHENVAGQCAARYDECMALCEGLNDHPEPHACSN